ncbi:MAG TPA: 1-deoxy-D-xylulose-5-phosphate synthase [Candidatus Angelobacter sp.]|nr:1-deoxy-D-xylulose-5-phosphate synthase [Candidatus Angelobacter sp.]
MKKTRIMYIEDKSEGITGPARIGRVTFSKTGKSIYYQGRLFHSLKGAGFKANYYEAGTGAEFWISGCKKDGSDQLYGGTTEIDDDVRDEYWMTIRKLPEMVDQKSIRDPGKYRR